jgi:Fibronectin type III domain
MRKISELTVVRADGASSWSSQTIGFTRVLVSILFLALLHISDQAFGAAAPATNNVRLAWNKSPSTNVTGYRVYYRSASGSYSNSVVTGNVTNNTVGGLTGGVTYFIAVAAYTASGVLSDPSNEISYMPALPAAPVSVASTRRGVVVVSGVSGKQYDILATQNLTTWTLIGTVTLGASGTVNFTDPNTANFSRRFYRIQQKP